MTPGVLARGVAKGKLVLAMASLVVPVLGAVGLARLARPESPWARLYDEPKRERARERFPEPWLPARVVRARRARRSRDRTLAPDRGP